MTLVRRSMSLFLLVAVALMMGMTIPVSAQDDYDVEMSGTPQTAGTAHFLIHYTLTGEDAVTLDYVEAVKEAVEKAWQVQVDLFGYGAPPPDDGRGGDDRYDVYLVDLTEDDALGITSPEDFVGDNINTPAREDYAYTSILSVENDFADIDFLEGQDAFTLMLTTVAHEFSHAIQFGYDFNDAHYWIYEATATWMETQTAGVDQDATGYVGDVFTYPELCFGSEVDEEDYDRHYGQWLYIDHIAQDFGADIVRRVWEISADYEGFEVLERALAEQNAHFADTFADFHLRNIARDYELGDLFDSTVWLEDVVNSNGWFYEGAGIEELSANYFLIELKGTYTVELTDDDGDLQLYSIGIDGDQVDTFFLERAGTINPGKYDEFYVMVFNPNYDEDLEECEAATFDLTFTTTEGELPRLYRQFNGSKFEPLS